jgi:hypothetical protein
VLFSCGAEEGQASQGGLVTGPSAIHFERKAEQVHILKAIHQTMLANNPSPRKISDSYSYWGSCSLLKHPAESDHALNSDCGR